MTAPSLRPRLGAVGGLLGVTVFLLATALTGWRDAVRGPDVDWTLPGVGLLVLGLAAAALTVLARRWRSGDAPFGGDTGPVAGRPRTPLSGRDV